MIEEIADNGAYMFGIAELALGESMHQGRLAAAVFTYEDGFECHRGFHS